MFQAATNQVVLLGSYPTITKVSPTQQHHYLSATFNNLGTTHMWSPSYSWWHHVSSN